MTELRLAEAERALRDAVTKRSDLRHAFWSRDGVAYVFLTVPGDDSRQAEISTPGESWYKLQVTGNYLSIDIATGMTVAEYGRALEDYVELAGVYLDSRPMPTGRFFPAITLETALGPRRLERAVNEQFRDLISGAWRKSGPSENLG